MNNHGINKRGMGDEYTKFTRRGIPTQRPVVYADRIGWEQGVSDGGTDAKRGTPKSLLQNGESPAFKAGYSYGYQLERTKGTK